MDDPKVAMGSLSAKILGPCTLISTGAPPQVLECEAVRADAEEVLLRIDGMHAALDEGERVVIDGPWGSRLMGTVIEETEDGVKVALRRVVPKDRRTAPRGLGGIELLYQVARHTGDVKAWLAGKKDAGGQVWHRPDPYMSFSSSGLRFEDQQGCAEGDLILLRLAIPGSGQSFRGTARVVRVRPIPESERSGEASCRIAVAFVDLDPEARDALVERVLEIARSDAGV